MSLERAKKLKEVTLRILLHTAGQKGIIVVAGTKARLSINARLGNSLPVIGHKQAASKKLRRKRATVARYLSLKKNSAMTGGRSTNKRG